MLTQSLQLSTTSHLFKQALRCATRQISRFDKVQSCKEHQQSPAALGPETSSFALSISSQISAQQPIS